MITLIIIDIMELINIDVFDHKSKLMQSFVEENSETNRYG
jgi:hypothetical protein